MVGARKCRKASPIWTRGLTAAPTEIKLHANSIDRDAEGHMIRRNPSGLGCSQISVPSSILNI